MVVVFSPESILECEKVEYNTRTMRDASNCTSRALSEQGKRLTSKLVQVAGSSIQDSDDESTEFEHLLAEPRIEKGFVDDVLNLKSENLIKCLSNEGFSCPVDYHLLKDGSDAEVLASGTILGAVEDPKSDFLDGMLHRVDDVHLHNVIEDYLLDTEFSEKVLDYVSCEGPHLGNQDMDSCSQTLNKRDQGAVDISKSTNPAISVPDSASFSDAVDKMNLCELQENFRSTCGCDTSVKDRPWLKHRVLFGLENLAESGSACPLDSDMSSKQNDGKSTFDGSEVSPGRIYPSLTNGFANKAKNVGQRVEKSRFVGGDVLTASSVRSHNGNGTLNSCDGVITHKRLRKPTRRYIEETSDLKSRSCCGRPEFPGTNSRDKLRQARSHSQHDRNGFVATPLVYKQDALGGSSIQVPFAHRVWKGRPRKNASIMYSDQASEDGKDNLCPSPQESEDDMSDDNTKRNRFGKGGSRRKHHKRWSLPEVLKLVDGVSQYGVGRWTKIKRLFFQTSAHRTAVDLKDKWRNLLRAGAQLRSKRREVEGRKHPMHSIPPSVLVRVNELAIIYPYPREHKSKLVFPAPDSVYTPSSCSDDERAVRRKRLASIQLV